MIIATHGVDKAHLKWILEIEVTLYLLVTIKVVSMYKAVDWTINSAPPTDQTCPDFPITPSVNVISDILIV